MKKLLFSAAIFIISYQPIQACAWYDPDYEYFGLFAQEIIPNKAYEPFLLTYSSVFYGDSEKRNLADENIESWMKYFENTLTYDETSALVKIIDIKHLYSLRKGVLTHELFKTSGSKLYKKFPQAIDYLIQAKYMEPYMRFGEQERYDNNDYSKPIILKSASALPYTKTVAALISLYNAATNPEIKLRYGYQLIRFQHYTRNYDAAIQSFNKLVAPENIPMKRYCTKDSR